MKKTKFLALLLAILMMGSLAMAESGDDPVVVKAGDVTIGLSEAQAYFDYWYQYNASMFAQYGIPFTQEDLDGLLGMIMDSLAEQAIRDNKIAEYGLGEISDEEKEALREQVYAQFEENLATFAETYGLSVEEAREDVAAEGITPEYLYEESLKDVLYMRLQEYTMKDVSVTDENVQSEFDALVEKGKETYGSDAASYEYDTYYNGVGNIYYTPEGYRYVKHILLEIPETLSAEMADVETDRIASKDRLDALTNELYAVENPVEGDVEATTVEDGAEAAEEPRTADEINADIAQEQTVYDELDTKYKELSAQILPMLQPVIDEIHAKLEEDASFDDLVAEYNTDPGMVGNLEGYQVHIDSIRWNIAFRDAAMALENVGDVSEPIVTDFGVHIIEYAGDVPSGPVELTDEIKASIRELLLVSLQDEAFYSALDTWKSEIEVETHPELIKLPDLAEAAVEPEAEDAGEEEQEPVEEDEVNEDGSVG